VEACAACGSDAVLFVRFRRTTVSFLIAASGSTRPELSLPCGHEFVVFCFHAIRFTNSLGGNCGVSIDGLAIAPYHNILIEILSMAHLTFLNG